ncbi:MAG: 4Fe-4S binding protein, partial [Methanomassiliicoccales archaeon]|nr:4Fe-4S binding protein [Methanomassiliicoccales archaeon]
CCPCCCLWKMLPELSPGISRKIKRLPGLRIVVDDKCQGCGECLEKCYVHAIDISDGRAIINDELCKGCGRCAEACPEGAIRIEMLDPSFIETTIDELDPLVDVLKE